jgi:hypothetical protein
MGEILSNPSISLAGERILNEDLDVTRILPPELKEEILKNQEYLVMGEGLKSCIVLNKPIFETKKVSLGFTNEEIQHYEEKYLMFGIKDKKPVLQTLKFTLLKANEYITYTDVKPLLEFRKIMEEKNPENLRKCKFESEPNYAFTYEKDNVFIVTPNLNEKVGEVQVSNEKDYFLEETNSLDYHKFINLNKKDFTPTSSTVAA